MGAEYSQPLWVKVLCFGLYDSTLFFFYRNLCENKVRTLYDLINPFYRRVPLILSINLATQSPSNNSIQCSCVIYVQPFIWNISNAMTCCHALSVYFMELTAYVVAFAIRFSILYTHLKSIRTHKQREEWTKHLKFTHIDRLTNWDSLAPCGGSWDISIPFTYRL